MLQRDYIFILYVFIFQFSELRLFRLNKRLQHAIITVQIAICRDRVRISYELVATHNSGIQHNTSTYQAPKWTCSSSSSIISCFLILDSGPVEWNYTLDRICTVNYTSLRHQSNTITRKLSNIGQSFIGLHMSSVFLESGM